MSARNVIEAALTVYFATSRDPQAMTQTVLAQYDSERRAEALATDGQAYDGELAMLRGLFRTLRPVVRHVSDAEKLAEVQRLLHEHARDDADARKQAVTR